VEILGVAVVISGLMLAVTWGLARIVTQTVSRALEMVYGPKDLAQPKLPDLEQPTEIADLYPAWEEEPWSLPASEDGPRSS
jgi:glycosyltransferase A (GT-A) superfamily protein (DUF2064 family)